MKIIEYPKEPKNNSVELSTAKKTFSQIQKSAQEITKQQAIEAAKNIVSASAIALTSDNPSENVTREEFETFKQDIEQRLSVLEGGE